MINGTKKDWAEAIREKYLTEAEKVPVTGWDALESRLHRSFVLRRAVSIAAAVLIPVSVLLLWSPWHDNNTSSIPAVVAGIDYVTSAADNSLSDSASFDQAPIVSEESSSARIMSSIDDNNHQAPEEQMPTAVVLSSVGQTEVSSEGNSNSADKTASVNEPPVQTQSVQPQIQVIIPSDYVAFAEPRSQTNNKMSISMDAGIGAVGSFRNTTGTSWSNMGAGYMQFDLSQALTQKIHHDLPLSLGLQVRLSLSLKIGVATGIEYTYLHSSLENDKYTLDQRLHLIGVPIRFDYNILSSGNWQIYAGLGGKAEKCVSASVNQIKYEEPQLQWSAEAFAGIQYHLSNHTSLYFQPELSYFFTQTNLMTYRTEYPLGLTVNAGIRVDFK